MPEQPQIDLSGMSDADLDAISKGDMSKVSDDGLKHISGQSADKGASTKSLLYEFLVTGHGNKPGKEPVEPTTAAQLLAPAAMASAAPIATEAADGAIATDVGSYVSRAADAAKSIAGSKAVKYGSALLGGGAIARRLGLH